jgi:predicted nucleic-acid-binding protein
VRKIFLDTDIFLNWLFKEEDPKTGFKLWKAPHEIMKRVEMNKLEGFTSIFVLMEIRTILSRKKGWKKEEIISLERDIKRNFEILLSDLMDILESAELQLKEWTTPIDTINILLASKVPRVIFITRDKEVLERASKYVKAVTPEEL